MPIWAIILISFSCSYVGSIFGGLAVFGILFGNKKTLARYLNEVKAENEKKAP